MGLWRIYWGFFLTLLLLDQAHSAKDQYLRIALFDTGHRHVHQQKVIQILSKELKQCKRCKIYPYTVQDQSGKLNPDAIRAGLYKAKLEGAQIYHISWNMSANEKAKPLIKELNELSARGAIIVGPAGMSDRRGLLRLKLKNTVLGQVKGAFIIGQILRGDTLADKNNYGPELFTALRTKYPYNEVNFPAAYFTGKLVTALRTRKHKELIADLLWRNKNKGDKNLLNLKDLFEKREPNPASKEENTQAESGDQSINSDSKQKK